MATVLRVSAYTFEETEMPNPDLFTRLEKIFPPEVLLSRDTLRLTSGGFMPFVVEVLARKDDCLKVSLAHYCYQNGDAIPDPDVVVEICLKARTIKPLSIQMSMGAVVETTLIRDGKKYVNTARMKDLASFLGFWFHNLCAQGFHWSESKGQTSLANDEEPQV